MLDFNKIAKKWQSKWEKSNIFKVREDKKKKKFYCLEMYPYPSSSSLHMGHARNYCIGDCYARYKRMQGFNVLYPMGYDSFGLPAENAAIKAKSHPKIFTEKAIELFASQQKRLGLSYDWNRIIASHNPEYYKWNQWFFIKLYEKGLAYRKKAPVNWCNNCGTVLANEQVHDGKCWRCHNEVSIRQLEQWFLKITDYADELLDDIKKLDGWPKKVRVMQENWIGKSYGTEIYFRIEHTNDIIPVFTTRADTLFGVTFMIFAPEHPKILELVKGTKYEDEVKKFIKKVVIQDRFSRTAENKEKEGMFIGKYAINPINNERIPIYIGNFVLLEYGAGAIMAVPAHDQRDFEFAKKYNIPIKVVINPPDYELNPQKMSRAYMDDGILVNSKEFNGFNNKDAIEEISKYLENRQLGKKTVQYKLRDWLISRQRYWGTPIPMIFCEKCGIQAVPEKDLPVLLPEKVEFTGEGNPLAKNKRFLYTECPKCKGNAKRETDTMDTFFDSSWYYLRYCDNKNQKEPFSKDKIRYWMPVDQYIGGVEHAVMHLLYARFFVKVLRDLKMLNFNEPFIRLFNQGMLHKDGFVMSKSRGNIVTQDEIEKKYGIDTARLFLLFIAGPNKDMEWSDEGIDGSYRFLKKIFKLTRKKLIKTTSKELLNKMHKTIKITTESIEDFKFNKAIIAMMEYVNFLSNYEEISKQSLEVLSLLLNPFTPHISEELWEILGNKPFASIENWPKYNEKYIDISLDIKEELIETTRKDINNVLRLAKIVNPKRILLFISPKWKYEVFKKVKKELTKTRNIGEIIKKVIDKEHGKEISQLIPKLVKDPSKIPQLILEQKVEFDNLEKNINLLEAEFKCEIKLIRAEDSSEEKAKHALPGKPAVLIN
jgi:leucyl-tRNA synthetase